MPEFQISTATLAMRAYANAAMKGILLPLFICTALQAQAADSDFQAAQRAAQSGNLTALDMYRQQMQDSVLAPYPEYWQLNKDLVLQPADAIRDFADRYPNAAISEKLLGDYIEAKARAGDYASIRQVASRLTNPDSDESCAVAQATATGGDVLALSSLRNDVWLKTGKISDLCSTIADQLLSSPLISDDDRVQRLRTMLRAGLVNRALPVASRLNIPLDASKLASIATSPSIYLASAPIVTLQDQMYYFYALGQLATDNPDAVNDQLTRDQSRLPPATLQYGYRILAMAYATNIMKFGFDQRVVTWFDRSVGMPFSDEEAEAYARTAIRFSQWNSLLRALDAMGIEKQNERIWRYWFARATEQRGDAQGKQVSKTFYTALATDDDYYGLLARDKLGLAFNELPPSYQPSSADYRRMQNDIHFQRAFALRAINADPQYANREWNWAVRQASLKQDDGMILAAADQANKISWFDRAIYAAERTSTLHNDRLRYLTPFRDLTEKYSKQIGLDPAWVYGLIRQESRFVINARSNVGAGGLMQVMPSTARWVAARIGEPFRAAQLGDMDTNIRYGTFYLNHIFGQLGGQAVLATAGYNAGPLRAKRWQPPSSPLAADQYTETIPFLETRDYVKKVMTNAVHYGLIFNQGQQSLSARMGTIAVQNGQEIVGP
ncbi:lytic transglycosylase domain-containing protein [Aquirhabdus parva]|uniref:Lytic transglycosylase n=1 Tax=Aquirhabdus parva TaxID=2283318 RepID=A0A345P7K0_9GAMM|nr:lytic transglycosylase domain-containing protein [Aquirhabdus parva]AXI03259.1 lytic transglycosylase [Aquirhabdus parva]